MRGLDDTHVSKARACYNREATDWDYDSIKICVGRVEQMEFSLV